MVVILLGGRNIVIPYFWCIIRRMLELYKRTWQVFFPVFAALLLGAVGNIIWLNDKWYMPLIAIVLGILALIFLVMATMGYIYDYRDARRKDKENEAAQIHKKLVDSFKRKGRTEKQAELEAKNQEND